MLQQYNRTVRIVILPAPGDDCEAKRSDKVNMKGIIISLPYHVSKSANIIVNYDKGEEVSRDKREV